MKPSIFSDIAIDGAKKRLFPSAHSRTPSSNFDSNLYDFEENSNSLDNQLSLFNEDSGWNISFDNIHLLEKIAQAISKYKYFLCTIHKPRNKIIIIGGIRRCL